MIKIKKICLHQNLILIQISKNFENKEIFDEINELFCWF